MTERKNISVSGIENAVTLCGASFSVRDVAKKCGDVSAATRDRIYHILDGDDRFFSRGDDFVRRDAFFNGKSFPVTPDEREIAEGILVPGHRFAPFISPEVFPSETLLREKDLPVGKKTITAPLGGIFHYHLLLGSEQLFDFLVAESTANAHLRRSRSGNEAVTLEVFDLAAFYRKHDFRCGDAVVCKIVDFQRGKLEISYLPGESRTAARRQKAVASLDAALTEVFDRFEEYLDVPEQLAWGFFLAQSADTVAGISLDEYIRDTQKIAIRSDGDHAVLVPVDRTPEGDDGADGKETPGFLSLSRGETGSLEAILKSLGNSFTSAEMDAFILDACFDRARNFGSFFRRFFGNAPFSDTAQREILYAMLEERFETLFDGYNRADDENKAPIRHDILDAVEERQAFFDFLAETGKEPSIVERELLGECAKIFCRLGETLKKLGDPAFTPDRAEAENLEISVGKELENFDRVMEKLNGQTERN